MSENNPAETPREPDAERVSELRRRVLQALAAAAVGVTILPSAWTKPIVGSIIVPAHAAVSPASPTPGLSQSNTPTPTNLILGTQTPTPTPSPSRSMTPTPTPSPSRIIGRGGRDGLGPLGIRR